MDSAKRVAFVAPQLPHLCELEILNACACELKVPCVLITSKSEEKNFFEFVKSLKLFDIPLALNLLTLETIPENKSFLAGLENELDNFHLVIGFGEGNLASYQCIKSKSQNKSRFLVWQTSSRPPLADFNNRKNSAAHSIRERTIRAEVLRNTDALLSFDKDGATWAFLEDVSAQRIKRLSRCVNFSRFSHEISLIRRQELRRILGLPESDFIFLHSGPLEVESGAIDSLLAFKNLQQSYSSYEGKTKLCFIGSGSAAAYLRQMVVNLKLENEVFFLSPSNHLDEISGNLFTTVQSLCDSLIYGPLVPTNGDTFKCFDGTYDVMCALASGLHVISNGANWIGDWVGRFYKTFSSGNIHSLTRLMHDAIDKQDKIISVKNSIKKAMKNEFSFAKTVKELSLLLKNLMSISEDALENSSHYFKKIEEMLSAKKYLDVIELVAQAFRQGDLSAVQESYLFRIIGDCFTKLGDLDNGNLNYLKAVELDPYNARGFIGLGTVALQKCDHAVAVPFFQKAVAFAPKDDMANLGLGLAFEGLKEAKESFRWTARACHLNPDNTVAIYQLVKLSYEHQVYEETRRILEEYVSRHRHDVNMIYTLGGIYFILNEFDEVKRLMNNILTLDPTNSRALGLMEEVEKKVDKQRHA